MRLNLAPLALLASLLAACGPADLEESDADTAAAAAQATSWPPPGRLVPLSLQRAAIAPPAGRPSAVAYLPQRFDASAPLHVLVYLHGWNNCVENVVRPVGAACRSGGAVRQGFNLAGQVEAANKNLLLLVPELSFDKESSSAGNLEQAGYFRALLDEALRALAPQLGGRTVANVATVTVASHSGGYNAAAAVVARGSVPVTQIALFDSLYAREADFLAFLQSNKGDLGAQPWSGARRFLTVYTDGGGTTSVNRDLAGKAAGLGLPAAALQDDRTTSTWDLARFQHGVLFKRSALSHDDTARYYLTRFLLSSRLPEMRPPNS